MSEREYESLSLVGWREPDYTTETAGDGTKQRVELPGIYHVGVRVNGAFLELSQFKAGQLNNSAAQAARKRDDERAESGRVAKLQQEQADRERQQQEQVATATASTDVQTASQSEPGTEPSE